MVSVACRMFRGASVASTRRRSTFCAVAVRQNRNIAIASEGAFFIQGSINGREAGAVPVWKPAMVPFAIMRSKIACFTEGAGLPTLILSATRIQAAGNMPKLIDEYVGRVNSREDNISVAHMRSPAG